MNLVSKKIRLSLCRLLILGAVLFTPPVNAHNQHELYFKASPGDAFYKFFFKSGLSGGLLNELMSSDGRAKQLNNIYPGDQFKISLDDNHNLKKIIYKPVSANPMIITYSKKRFRFLTINVQPTAGITHSTIVITKSLNYDAKEFGIEAEIIKLMVDNFSWELDFRRDLSKGDKFILAWNGSDKPLAMIYVGNRRTISLFSYKDAKGKTNYYQVNGKTLNDSFFFAPLKYDRISSGFQKRRFHPIKKTWKSHRGTDFAAPQGRPIYAAAKGIIRHVAVLSGYGNVVYIDHGTHLTTVYAHMARFEKGLRSGNRVSKGQVVGYVGSTGLSTGPHLHYEIRLDGVHKDPEKYSPPKQLNVPQGSMAEFVRTAKEVLAKLNI